MVTWIPSIYPSHVSIYTSTMDPMGVYSLNPLRVIKFYTSQWISPVLSDPFRNPNCTKWRSYSYISVYIIYMYTHYQLQKKNTTPGGFLSMKWMWLLFPFWKPTYPTSNVEPRFPSLPPRSPDRSRTTCQWNHRFSNTPGSKICVIPKKGWFNATNHKISQNMRIIRAPQL